MDYRDKWLIIHHKKRLNIAKGLERERLIDDAKRHLTIAEKQGRFQYVLIMRLWLHKLETGDEDE